MEYNVKDYSFVLDSISRSGTEIGPWQTVTYTLDDGSTDFIDITALYKKDAATGSIQVRKADSLFNVKIIDVVKK